MTNKWKLDNTCLKDVQVTEEIREKKKKLSRIKWK
jgi:hypothetical protein